jgi:uncharacterized protein
MLYADTALGGEVAPTRCGHAFFGTRHCLFATDAPFDPERGRAIRWKVSLRSDLPQRT